jgi:hypothetical protein
LEGGDGNRIGWCSVLKANVTKVIGFDEVSAVICPEFEPAMKTCRLKKATVQYGPLSQLLDRVSEETLTEPSPHCNLA